MEPDALARLYAAVPEQWFGKMVNEDWVYVECGRRQAMPFLTATYPTPENIAKLGMAAFPPRRSVMQVTVRDVKICEKYQHCGQFTGLIKHLLCDEQVSIQLEAVTNKELMNKLEESPRWIRQTDRECMELSANYVRFYDPASDSKNKPFSLF